MVGVSLPLIPPSPRASPKSPAAVVAVTGVLTEEVSQPLPQPLIAAAPPPARAQTSRLPNAVAARVLSVSARVPSRLRTSTSALKSASETGSSNAHERALLALFSGGGAEGGRAIGGGTCTCECSCASAPTPVGPLGLASEEEDASASARRAFRALAAQHKAQLAARDATIAALEAAAAATSPGGEQYALLRDELEWTQEEARGLRAKVASLVKLLDRAGATIRAAEEKRGGGSSSPSTAAVAMASNGGRVDWAPLVPHMRDLFARARTDAQIVETVAQYIGKLTAQVAGLETASEGTTARAAEGEARREAMMRTIQQQQREIDDLRDDLLRARREGGGGGGNGAGNSSGSDSIAALRREFEQERAKLLHQVTSLETAMRNTVTARPFFVALGKGVAVPPFLRFDGRVRNLSLSKAAVENMIVALWLTRFLPTLEGCPALEEAGLGDEARRRAVGGGGGGPRALMDVFGSTTVLAEALDRQFSAEGQWLAAALDSGAVSKRRQGEGGGDQSRFSLGNAAASIAAGSGGRAPSLSSGGNGSAPASPSSQQSPTGAGGGGGGGSLVDYDNLALWSIRRSDVRKLLSFHDHLVRFFVEMLRPDRISALFTNYTISSSSSSAFAAYGQSAAVIPSPQSRGVATPPVADIARHLRAPLLLCAPQAATLLRPAATVPPEVAEAAYALMDGCDRFSFDADVELFRRVAKGHLPEAAFYDQMLMLQKLRVALLRSAADERAELIGVGAVASQLHSSSSNNNNNNATSRQTSLSQGRRRSTAHGLGGSASSPPSFGNGDGDDEEEDVYGDGGAAPNVASVLRALRRFFPAKAADEFRLLQRALLLDVGAISLTSEEARVQKGGVGAASAAGGGPPSSSVSPLEGMGAVSAAHLALPVDVRGLFASNESGNQGYFLETVRNQHVEGLSTHMAEVQCAILSLGATALGPTAAVASPSPPAAPPVSGGGRRASQQQQNQQLQQQQAHAPLIRIRDRLAEIDPLKPRADVNDYLFHLLQLLYTDRARLGAADGDLVHKGRDEWFAPPLCYHPTPLEELARHCPLVLCKRCGPATAAGVGASGGQIAAAAPAKRGASKASQ